MTKQNINRAGCIDVFHSFLVRNAEYDGDLEIPKIKSAGAVPERLITFSKAIRCDDYNQWVCFYEDDVNFERIWNNPQRYLPILQKFKGVISPDFSLYRDMPLVMQQWNTYRGRAIAAWLQDNGVSVIPNVRWGDERTYELCCLGVEPNSTIAIGSHGCVKQVTERKQFERGLSFVVDKLNPRVIVVYGTTPDSIFEKYRTNGIQIVHMDTEFNMTHPKGGES